jgi:hypothetical protein
MTHNHKSSRGVAAQPNGPVLPGSPLHRVLQLIAREITREYGATDTSTLSGRFRRQQNKDAKR